MYVITWLNVSVDYLSIRAFTGRDIVLSMFYVAIHLSKRICADYLLFIYICIVVGEQIVGEGRLGSYPSL